MLQQIRPYCGIVIYLLLICYGGIIGKQTICNIYYSVAYTAKVLNASADFWGPSKGHVHSQEIALIQLKSFQETQAKDQTDEHQPLTEDVPNQKLKFFNQLDTIDFEELLNNRRNFLTAIFKPGHFKAISFPPPRT